MSENTIKLGKHTTIFKKIRNRIPVPKVKNDANREYMIKFKYDTITEQEFSKFHDNVKRLIYNVMHHNTIMMEWDDIYQEIWQKIIRCKHTWKEWKGTFVSTWITIVANSVINTLRLGVNRRNSRFCLYDDLKSSRCTDSNSRSDVSDIVLYQKSDESIMEKLGGRKTDYNWKNDWRSFVEDLQQGERDVLNASFKLQDEFLDSFEKGIRRPFAKLREMTGYDETTLTTILNNIKLKYESQFDVEIRQSSDGRIDDRNEILF